MPIALDKKGKDTAELIIDKDLGGRNVYFSTTLDIGELESLTELCIDRLEELYPESHLFFTGRAKSTRVK